MAGGELTEIVSVRFDKQDMQALKAAANDANHLPATMVRSIVQHYLLGYKGPYVLRVPMETEADGAAD